MSTAPARETRPGRLRALAVLCFVLVAMASVAPIRSYDAWWHLATGRWIVEQREIPERDPFGLASDPVPWHNGEWLFQVLLWLAYRAGGEPGLSILRALAVAALFTWLLLRTSRETTLCWSVLLCAIAFAGADARLGVRPEIAGVVGVAVATRLLLEPPSRRRIAAVGLTTLLLVNLHPSALLIPAIAGLVAAGRVAAGERDRRALAMLGASIAVPAAALFVTPHGLDGILAPIRLARIVSSGAFVNAEWLPSRPSQFPLLYLAIAGGLAALAWRAARPRPERHELPSVLPRLLLFALFSLLAIRYVRNHGIFFVTLPLLVAEVLPRLDAAAVRIAALAAAAIALVTVPLQRGIGLGADPARFPVSAVRQLETSGLRGNLYNPDQLGGYLIWWSYPERRVLTDGRNELYLGFIERFARARTDSRLWRELFREHDLTLAVEEYREGTTRVIDAATGRGIDVPPARVYFPEKEWALIGFDDVALVFARRDAFPESRLEALEYTALQPWIPAVDASSAAALDRAKREVARARREGVEGWRLESMERAVKRAGPRV
ncbi:MAG TPA: hypothetical protein VMS56_06725 [Thermoanaerobaculia bacterium]|nr:hypothetical protein [Thermoanaerobaculia bacterium]